MSIKICSTKEYTKFRNDETNRMVSRNPKLADSMEKHGWLDAYPMLVVKNGKRYSIKDGHHRFVIAQSLKLPVKYVVHQSNGFSIAELNNTQRKWSPKDYLTSYASQGLASYVYLKGFVERTKIGVGVACALLLGKCKMAPGGDTLKVFKEGTFEVRDADTANRVAGIVNHLLGHIKWARDRGLVLAIQRCCYVPQFSDTVFKQKVDSCPGALTKMPDVEGYIGLIEEIYNKRNKNQLPLKFMANIKARSTKE